MADTLTAKELREILAENRASGGSGFDTKNFSSLNTAVSGLTGKFDPFSSAVRKAGDAITGIKESINESMGAWQKLSATGANFNNDIVGMNVAAAGTRMSLSDFADIVGKNAANFAGLGTSVGQSSLTFAKLSKEMFDSGVTDQLRQMGMNSKEINETMALQMSTARSSFKDDQEGRRLAIESATKLSVEMDAISKLTGKSRAEQEESIKKAGLDASIRAKFLLLEAEDRKNGTNKAAEARLMFNEQYAKAEAQGLGQNFKEVFATGRIISQEAANNQAVLGEQARAVSDQALATANGNREAADAANERSKVAQQANLSNESNLRMTTFGEAGGAVAKVMANQLTSGGYEKTQAIAKLRQENDFKNATDEQALAEIALRIKREQAGKDKDGNEIAGAGTTKAVVQLQARVGDVNSALMGGLVKPLNESIGPKLSDFSTKYLGATVDRKTPTGVQTVGKGKAYEDSLAAGFKAGMENKNAGKSAKDIIKDRKGGEGYFGSDILGTAGATVGGLGNVGANVLDKVNNLDISKAVKSVPGVSGAEKGTTTKAPSNETGGKEATLNDVYDSLERLNKSVSTMNSHTEAIKDLSGKQVKATNGLSNNRFN